MVSYKQKCPQCRKNYVVVSWKNRYAKCYDCQKEALDKPIDDPKMKKMFDIPEEFYRNSPFLRDIKLSFIYYKRLSPRQIEAFKEAVDRMKNPKKKEPEPEEAG